MKAEVRKAVTAEVTLKMSVEQFRLLDAVQYFYLGGGLEDCLAINSAFADARNTLGVDKLPHKQVDRGFGAYFDAAAARAAEGEDTEDHDLNA